MKRAIIAHCWGGGPDYIWYPYVKNELEKEGFEVIVPQLPDTENPNLNTWLPALKDVVGKIDKDTYLIGHSAGCITIMRLLESLQDEQKAGGVVFVAGFTNDLGFGELKSFFTTPIDYEKIKKHSGTFVDIFSDNDPYVPLSESEVLKKKLGVEMVFKPGMSHFSDVGDGGGISCTELPDVVDKILEIANNYFQETNGGHA